VESRSASEEKKPEKDKKAQRQTAAAAREKLKPFTQVIRQIEQKMETLQKKLFQVEQSLAKPELYEGAGTELQSLLKEQGALRQELSQLEESWLEKSDELEQLQQSL